MDSHGTLTKYPGLEWKVPVSGGKSQKFLLQRQKCHFHFCVNRLNRYCALYVESESRIPLSFEVMVQTIYDGGTLTFTKKPVKGFAPHEIWSCSEKDAHFLAFGDTLSLRVMFDDGSNLRLAGDSNAETDIKTQSSSLKKVTCLEWNTQENLVNTRSPNFVFGDQECFFTCKELLFPGYIEGDYIEESSTMYTLTINSDTEAPLLFDATIQVGWDPDEEDTSELETDDRCIPPYNIWTSEQLYHLETERKFSCFRMIFSNCLNIELSENTGAKTVTGAEASPSTSEQFTKAPSYLESEIGFRSLSSDLRKLLLSDNSKPDIIIQCGACIIPTHRNILGTRSAKLKAMLQADTRILRIVAMEASVCRKFVEYLYTGSLPDLSVALALELYEAGKKYGVDSLKRQCCNFLRENLSDEDVLRQYRQ